MRAKTTKADKTGKQDKKGKKGKKGKRDEKTWKRKIEDLPGARDKDLKAGGSQPGSTTDGLR